jgi:anaerobic ribonucleoside-triphosphate reductase activating protein
MNYGEIKAVDVANGPGVRVSLFVSGCTNHCPGCFQPETWDFNYGQPFTAAQEEEVLKDLAKPFIRGLTLLGGDPFEPANQRVLLPFLKKVRQTLPDKDIWAFTGFRLDDELLREGSHPRCEATDDMLALIDVLVDGRFEESQKDISLQFHGSRNQRLIDLKASKAAGHIVLWDDPTCMQRRGTR